MTYPAYVLVSDLARLNLAMEGHVDPESQFKLVVSLGQAGLIGTTKPLPKDPEEEQAKEAARNDMRTTLSSYLLNNDPPAYTGDRGTAFTVTEILDRAGVPTSSSSSSILRNLLSQRFVHNWGIVDEVMGTKLYAHTPKLLRFRQAA